MRPLEGVRVLDFSTLLPGPLATLLLAEAGAEVVKIERPGRGDDMRGYEPRLGADSVNFALLNRGKRSVALDLKSSGALDRLRPLLEQADVLVEQFRPGVMDRLGLGYEALSAIQPRLVYCAVTGYGQAGPNSGVAAHDLNYAAETGLLSIAAGNDGAPVVPAALVADIGGGTLPAVINVLLALRQRDRTGRGCKLDVSMSDNLFTFLYWALGNGHAAGLWPRPGGELVSGGSPRYQIYRTADDRFIAAAPLEEQFWKGSAAYATEHRLDDIRGMVALDAGNYSAALTDFEATYSAYAEFQEKDKGSITPGKLADLVLLSDDVLTIDPVKIRDAKVLKTWVGGKLVYDGGAAH